MSNVTKQIYRKLNNLFPVLRTAKPFTRLDLKERGYKDIDLVIFDSNADEINFILSRFDNERGQLIGNPSIEIVANFKEKTANVVTYKDPHYFHEAVPEPDDIGEIALCQVNYFLNEFLNDIKKLNHSHKKPVLEK